MRIEAYTQVQQIYKANKPGKTQETKKGGFADQLQISSIGKDIQTARTAVAQSSDIRPELVQSVKDRIQAGTYQVDAESFADKLFAKYEELR
ncbi:MAG: flagellar biosynthesis anti-sigma factor FlgM [Lachnospiraceae bacterium]|nr:flagellar biosynthesis anti-sigma factor FlgM [Lachnospiraceae bacterium]